VEELALFVGEAISLTLPGLGSAGYQWTVNVDDATVASVVKLGNVRRTSASANSNASYDEQFAITALVPGQTVIHLVQRRVFQKTSPPHSARDILVRVKAR